MKQYVYSLLLALPLGVSAQPVLQVVQDFKVGTSAKYIKCTPVAPGANGAGITWNFTSLTALGGLDTLTVSYLAAGSTYAGANILEKTSDSASHFMTISGNTNQTVAYADSSVSGQNLTNVYTNTALSMQRPLTYGLNVTDTFAGNLLFGGYTLPTSGFNTRNINVTGHGILYVPGTTYNDVLKVRVEHKQTSSIASPAPILVNLTIVSYMWFDALHKSPLLRIDSMMVNGSPSPPVPNMVQNRTSYLINETYPQNVDNVYGSTINFNAYIKGTALTLEGDLSQNKAYTIALTNMGGQTVFHTEFTPISALNHFDTGHDLPPGMYLITVQEQGNMLSAGTIKIIK